MKGYFFLKNIALMILPFVILFGLYIILNGDLSPGGGFQGGVVLTACYLLLFFLKDEMLFTISKILELEKWLFLLLLASGALYMALGSQSMTLMASPWKSLAMTLSLMFFNLIIGSKVTLGLWSILIIFTEEGDVS